MKVLHISDIHMGAENNKPFAEMIIDSINHYSEQYSLYPDIMVVTGDFTNTGSLSEFENAKLEMLKIKESLPSIKECLIVPGNHDYLWKENGVDVAIDKRHISYTYFKNNCVNVGLCKPASKDTESINKDLEKYQIMHIFVKDETFALLVIGMNSDVLDSSERAGQGFFDKKQHDICRKLIKHYEMKCKQENIKLIIMAAFHHHILPVSSVERDTLNDPDKFSLTLDARRTLDFFMDNNVRLAIHGHQHQPSIVNWRDEMRESDNGVYVISAGSMTQNKMDLGDVSRNSYMIYDIKKRDIVVYCFCNKDDDWDVMNLSHEPYILQLESLYADVPCKIIENSNPPKGIEIKNFDATRDTSDLFYLFLNVVDCDQAREEIIRFSNEESEKGDEVQICGLHNLYGKYDVLLKYRTKDGDLFSRNLHKYLIEKKIILNISSCTPYFMNVSYENKDFKKIDKIPLIKNPEAYLNSTWNVATLTVYLERKLSPEMFLKKLNESIKNFNETNNTKIEDIIRDYAIGQDRSIIFELFISCYQFPMLTRFTNLIEDIIRDYGIDKSTHIIYFFDERCI